MKRTICTLMLALLASCNSGRGPVQLACGGASNFTCPGSMYCQLDDLCGGIDKTGYCAPRPLNCPLDIKPVCGCDKQTYDNLCWANIKEVSVHYEGPCQ